VRRALAAVLVAVALLSAGCSAPRTSCTNGVCVATDPDGIDHAWPEPAPETPGNLPATVGPIPAVTDRAGKKELPTAIPPGFPVNSPSESRDARIGFWMRRIGTGEVEIVTQIADRMSEPHLTYDREWHEYDYARRGTLVMMWISRNPPSDREDIECWITVDGEILNAATRPDGVANFNAHAINSSPFNCFVSTWVY
jgi:hypothetical protein